MKNRDKEAQKFKALIELVDTLRSENGCPWDKRQTLSDTRGYILEEAYELIDAIMDNDPEKIREELADVLFQCVFISGILEDNFKLTLVDLLQNNIDKMINRHPHVFSSESFADEGELLENWELTKKQENNKNKSIYSNMTKTLPSLSFAHKVQEKASRVGFDWETAQGPIDKIKEEIDEFISLKEGTYNKDHEGEYCDRKRNIDLEMEFGDILFSLVNLARFYKLDPELALRRSIEKFIQRFIFMESLMRKDNKMLGDMSQEEMDEYWENSKHLTKEISKQHE